MKQIHPEDIKSILKWFSKNEIVYPWSARTSPQSDPYGVWISEVMLQQTTVAAVLPRYSRWMERFPTLSSLSEADEEEVLREWEGLGYYSRARNLHSAAREVLSRYGGRLPDDIDELMTLPGVGEYTAAAVASIAFGRPAAVVDANIRRIIQRLEAQPLWHSKMASIYQTAAIEVMKEISPGRVNAAMMQFGQQLCLPRRPACTACPLQARCKARKSGIEHSIPERRQIKIIRKHSRIAIPVDGKNVLICRKSSGLLAGLWVFPLLSDLPHPNNWFPGEELDRQIHSYTRYRDELHPQVFRCCSKEELKTIAEAIQGEWKAIDKLQDYAMPSAYRLIANNLIRITCIHQSLS